MIINKKYGQIIIIILFVGLISIISNNLMEKRYSKKEFDSNVVELKITLEGINKMECSINKNDFCEKVTIYFDQPIEDKDSLERYVLANLRYSFIPKIEFSYEAYRKESETLSEKTTD